MCTSPAFSSHTTTHASESASTEEALSLDERADRHGRRLEGFYVHLAAYDGVNAVLVGINLFTSPDVFWAIWPLLGWGVKIAGHAVAVFGIPGRADWRERTRTAFLRRHGARPTAANRAAAPSDAPDSEDEQLRRRIEHLEAIVTSVDWDLVLDQTPDAPSAEKQTESLADEVVPS